MAGSGIGEILQKDTAGLPNWAWLLVVGAGLAAAYIIPKFLGGGNAGTSSTPTTGTDANGTDTGIGLAVDPTTGLPYAVEGLVPSGANAGNSQVTSTSSGSTSSGSSSSGSSSSGSSSSGSSSSGNTGQKWYTIPKWPNGDEGTFSQLASKLGVSVTRLEQLNPSIDKNAKLKSGWTIRVA